MLKSRNNIITIIITLLLALFICGSNVKDDMANKFVMELIKSEGIISEKYKARLKINSIYHEADKYDRLETDGLYYDTNMKEGILNIAKVDLDKDDKEEIIVLRFKKRIVQKNNLLDVKRIFAVSVYKISNDKYLLADENELFVHNKINLFRFDFGLKNNGNEWYLHGYLRGNHWGEGYYHYWKTLEFKNGKFVVVNDYETGFGVMSPEEGDLFVKYLDKSKIKSDIDIGGYYDNNDVTFLRFDENVEILCTTYNLIDVEKEMKENEYLHERVASYFFEFNESLKSKHNLDIKTISHTIKRDEESFKMLIDRIECVSKQTASLDVEKLASVKFGKYEQDNNIENGQEDIEWIVLEKKNGKALLLSKYILDCKNYNYDNYCDTNWEESTIREWLNSIFYSNAFSDDEAEIIIHSKVINNDNDEYKTKGGNDTEDYVFLLSIDEVKNSFIVNAEYGESPKISYSYNNLASKGTDYALCVNNYENTLATGDIGGDKKEWYYDYSPFLLRSPGHLQNSQAAVRETGYLDTYGYDIDPRCFGIRPALWVKY